MRDLGIEAQVEAIDTMLSRQGADEEEQQPDEPESPAIAERQKAFAETIRQASEINLKLVKNKYSD